MILGGNFPDSLNMSLTDLHFYSRNKTDLVKYYKLWKKCMNMLAWLLNVRGYMFSSSTRLNIKHIFYWDDVFWMFKL